MVIMSETELKCRYPDPDEYPEECGHYYVEGAGRCRRDGMPCEVFGEGNDDDARNEKKAAE
jgi:hypothetical protein